jgi:hypothetical protein
MERNLNHVCDGANSNSGIGKFQLLGNLCGRVDGSAANGVGEAVFNVGYLGG